MDALTDLDRRLGRVREIPVAAVLHSYLHLVTRRLAHRMLDTVTRKSTANRSRNRCQNAAASSSNLISQQAASDRSTHGPQTRRRFRFLDCIDGDNFASIRVNGDRPWCELCRVLRGVVVRISLSLLNRHAPVMMDTRMDWRFLPRDVLLRRYDRRTGNLRGDRYRLGRRRGRRPGRGKNAGHGGDTGRTGQDDGHSRTGNQRVNTTALR